VTTQRGTGVHLGANSDQDRKHAPERELAPHPATIDDGVGIERCILREVMSPRNRNHRRIALRDRRTLQHLLHLPGWLGDSNFGGDAPPFLGDDDAYHAERDALVERIQNTAGLSAVSGYIAFGEPARGNWYDDRMVQLVVVGPRGEDGSRQHVVAACGRISPSTVDPGPGCV
jgi:hypothetical protein